MKVYSGIPAIPSSEKVRAHFLFIKFVKSLLDNIKIGCW